jgi:hypothetical protein
MGRVISAMKRPEFIRHLGGAAAWPLCERADAARFATTKVDGCENVYIFRYVRHQSMFVVTPAGGDRYRSHRPAAAGGEGLYDARAALAYLQDLSAAVKKAADEHKCLAETMRDIKLRKYEKWANYDAYLPMNIERYCDFYSLGI